VVGVVVLVVAIGDGSDVSADERVNRWVGMEWRECGAV